MAETRRNTTVTYTVALKPTEYHALKRLVYNALEDTSTRGNIRTGDYDEINTIYNSMVNCDNRRE